MIRSHRVLHVTALEASNYYLNSLVDASAARTIDYSFASLWAESPFTVALRQRGCRVHALDARRRRQLPSVVRRLTRIVREDRIDLLHGHMFDPSLAAVLAGRLSGRPVVLTRHHSDALYRIPARWKRTSYLALERWMNASVAHIIAPSRMVRDLLVGREGVAPDRVTRVPYGQSARRFEEVSADAVAAARQELGAGSRHLVCVSRLHEEKGHRALLAAFARVSAERSGLVLNLVGEGPERAPLISLSHSLGIAPRVRFLGWRADALPLLAAADLVVHAALQEALPSAVIEALMLEKPLVATDVSGVRDASDDGRYARLVPPGDEPALAAALIEVLDDLGGAQELARGARAFILAAMSEEAMAEAYEAIYVRVLKDHQARRGDPGRP